MRVYSFAEGSFAFPREPLLRVEGPLGITQLLETTLLTLINFASLVTTNAKRFRLVADERTPPGGAPKVLLEFGLRRAQGPDGGMSASRLVGGGGREGSWARHSPADSAAAAELGGECGQMLKFTYCEPLPLTPLIENCSPYAHPTI